jgi:hypothetical protein
MREKDTFKPVICRFCGGPMGGKVRLLTSLPPEVPISILGWQGVYLLNYEMGETLYRWTAKDGGTEPS